MGLADILTGMMNGPRGQRQPSSGGSGSGMSPIMMALLGLLAYKALKAGVVRLRIPAEPADRSRLAPQRAAALRALDSTISSADCSAANQAARQVPQPPAPSPVAA
jgi:Tfp pilus assembly protein PilX